VFVYVTRHTPGMVVAENVYVQSSNLVDETRDAPCADDSGFTSSFRQFADSDWGSPLPPTSAGLSTSPNPGLSVPSPGSVHFQYQVFISRLR
jgi:hypothetical protein